jgi:hypothetical protein
MAKPARVVDAGHFKVEIYAPVIVKSLPRKHTGGYVPPPYIRQARRANEQAIVRIRPRLLAGAAEMKPVKGRGGTIREHEEFHVQDYLKILAGRQPPESRGGAYHRSIAHTRKLLGVCSGWHTDAEKVTNKRTLNECIRLLSTP